MNKDRMEGVAKQIKGRLQQALGRMTGDDKLVLRGRANQIAGEAEAGIARAMAAGRTWTGRRRIGV
ncbi:CsbD family protein [Methylopila musalis]|uniref:CsbD family protein n=1 Tax=Methylopila musalis TaxID=1134781 RepID=A0ABW3ZBG0_9HYPH